MIKIYLVLAFIINGVWVSGTDLPYGWHPVQYDTLDECLERAEYFNRYNPEDDSTAYCVVVSEENDRYD